MVLLNGVPLSGLEFDMFVDEESEEWQIAVPKYDVEDLEPDFGAALPTKQL